MSICTSAISPAISERRRAEPGREVLDHVRVLEQRMAADDQVDAGGHHRRRVDQGADRRRAFHRVRQPGVQRDLRRLRDRAAEQPERDQVRDRAAVRRRGEHAGVVELARCAGSAGRARAPSSRRRTRSSRTPSWRRRSRTAGPGGSRSAGSSRARPSPSRRAGAAGCRPRRAAASRRRTATCRRSSAAPRPRRPCSRPSTRRSGSRRRRRSASSSRSAGRRAA